MAAVVILTAVFGPLSAATADDVVEVRVEYTMRGAAVVYLVWGIDNWQSVDPQQRPSDTFIKKNVMHTILARQGDSYVATLRVPAGSKIDYGFLVEKSEPRSEYDQYLWDGGYETIPIPIIRSNTISYLENRTLYRFAAWVIFVTVVGLGLTLLVVRMWRSGAPMRTVAALYAVNIVPIALAVIGAETYLHRTNSHSITIGPPARYEFEPDPKKGIVPDGVLGWVTDQKRPGINVQGFRDRKDFAKTREDSDKIRVMVLGDSFAWGVGVEAAQNVTSQLERRLGENFEVYNLGVPGFGISQMYASYSHFKRTINPDIVVLLFIDNDVLRDLDGGKPAFRLANGELRMRNTLTWGETAANAATDASRLAGRVLKEVFYVPRAYRVAARELSAIDEDVRAGGGRFLGFRIPVPPKGIYASSVWANAFGWSTLTRSSDATLIDSEKLLTKEIGWQDKLYLNDPGSHFTVAGNEAMAQIIKRQIDSIDMSALRRSRSENRERAMTNVTRPFHMANLGPERHAFLVWGINGWKLPTADRVPSGSEVRETLVVTPMEPTANGYKTTLTLPKGTFVDYNLKVVDDAGRLVHYDNNDNADYHELF